jgi:hypothetical protein
MKFWSRESRTARLHSQSEDEHGLAETLPIWAMEQHSLADGLESPHVWRRELAVGFLESIAVVRDGRRASTQVPVIITAGITASQT